MRLVILVLCALIAPLPGLAQEAWVQIAAERNIDRARAVAERFAGALPGLALVELGSNWIAVAAGPMQQDEAETLWRDLRAAGVIPQDSYLSDGERFGAVLWRAGPPLAPGESAADTAELREVQRALAFEAYYAGPLDGRLSAETRAAIARWRSAAGTGGTGPLDAAETAALLGPMQAAEAPMGFETVRDAVAGITVDIPGALVAFDRHDAPYALYAPRDDSAVALRLISLPGAADALPALYDRLQADPAMPETGFRELRDESFVIMGSDAERRAYGWAEAGNGAIKGFLLTWPAGDLPGLDLETRDRAVSRLRASFRPEPARVMALPPDWDVLSNRQTGAAAAPVLWRRAGVAVSADGAVLTVADGLESCAGITLGTGRAGRVVASDGQLALLQPEEPAGPALPATLLGIPAAPGTPVTLAGFGQDGGSLRATPIPALILRLEDGDLALDAALLQGDDGGPVLTGTGALAGLVLPGAAAPRALAAPALRTFLEDAGVLLAEAAPDAVPLTPLAQAQRARLLTVAVTCTP